MWGWFGGASAQKRKDAPKNAILLLRQQLDMLQKRERHLESQMADQDALARKNLATNKTGKDPIFRNLQLTIPCLQSCPEIPTICCIS
jgi:charged multivesicular body protein 4A/B